MQKRIKGIISEYSLTISVLLLIGIFLFAWVFCDGASFAWYNDQLYQHNIFYHEWYRIIAESIENGFPSFYSWNTFLGTDFFVSKLMYCVGDFFLTPLFIVIASLYKDAVLNFDVLLAIETIICLLLSGATMQTYLKKFGIQKKEYRLIFASIYALSGFVVIYAGSYMFHRFYALMPLLFFFVERYIQNNKKTGFAIMVALLFLQNYELMFATSFFLVLYFIFRYKLISNLSIGRILLKAFPLIISYLIGIMLCGFALMPLVYFLFSNPRVGTMNFGTIFWDFNTIISFATNLVVPAFNFRSDNPPYLFYTNQHFSQEYGVFVTMLGFLAILHLWKRGSKKEKSCFFTGLTIILLFIFIRPLNMIVHGFSEPTLRWTFLFSFFILILAAYSFDRYPYKIKDMRLIIVSSIIFVVLLFLYLFINNYDLSVYWVSILIIIVSLLMLYLYHYLLLNNSLKLMYLVALINCGLFLLLTVFGKNAYQLSEPAFDEEYLAYHEQEDDTKLFRYYFPTDVVRPFSNLNLNASILYDYRTTTTYDSTYDAAVRPFLDLIDIDSWIIDIDNPEILQMLGVKYVGVLDEASLPSEDMEYVFDLNNIKVYVFKKINSIGHTYNNFVTDADGINWNEELLVNSEDLNILQDIAPTVKKQLKILEYNRQYFKGEIDVNAKTILYVAIPYSEGWNIVNQDGESLETINVQGGFLGVIIDENDRELSFYYGTPGLKNGLVITTVGLLALMGLFYFDKRKKI